MVDEAMQTANGQTGRAVDIGMTILTTMRQMGVSAIPRNYEIFYEVLTGSNQALAVDLVSLSKKPSQSELDDLSCKHLSQNNGQRVVEQVRDVVAHELEDIARLLRSERTNIERYGELLSETRDGLADPRLVTRDIVSRIASVMAVATQTTLRQGRALADTLGEKTLELENVKSKLEEYKKLADTDSLTQLWNRRAFDKRQAQIYDDQRTVMFGALMLADIDAFKGINDRFGHPVGDKIIQTIASLLRSNLPGNAFVARTGGEEFAVIVDGVSEDAVLEIAERLRNAVAQASFARLHPSMSAGTVTISIGTCMASEADGAEDLYMKADRALYRSKISGRNSVTSHSSLAAMNRAGGKSWMLYRSN